MVQILSNADPFWPLHRWSRNFIIIFETCCILGRILFWNQRTCFNFKPSNSRLNEKLNETHQNSCASMSFLTFDFFNFFSDSGFTHKFYCCFQRKAEVDLRYTTIILLAKSIVASSGSRFEIHNDNFIHKIHCRFRRKSIWDTQRQFYSQNPLSLPAEVDLRYTTIILLTKSIVASSGSRFEIHNNNFQGLGKQSQNSFIGFQWGSIWDTQR